MGSIPRPRLEEVFLGSYGPGMLVDIDWEMGELWGILAFGSNVGFSKKEKEGRD